MFYVPNVLYEHNKLTVSKNCLYYSVNNTYDKYPKKFDFKTIEAIENFPGQLKKRLHQVFLFCLFWERYDRNNQYQYFTLNINIMAHVTVY